MAEAFISTGLVLAGAAAGAWAMREYKAWQSVTSEKAHAARMQRLVNLIQRLDEEIERLRKDIEHLRRKNQSAERYYKKEAQMLASKERAKAELRRLHDPKSSEDRL